MKFWRNLSNSNGPMARFLQDFVQYFNAVFSSDILGNIARNTARNTAKNTNKAVQITGLRIPRIFCKKKNPFVTPRIKSDFKKTVAIP